MYREEGRNLDTLLCLIRIVADETDEFLGSRDLVRIAVVKDTEAPDTAAELCRGAVLSRELHRDDVVAVVGLSCLAVVGIVLLRCVPAEGNRKRSVSEELNLISADQRRIEVDALLINQCLESLGILRTVDGVLSVLCIRECSAVQIVHQCSCSLIAALSCAVDSRYILLTTVIDCLDSLEEVFCRPGVIVEIKILKRIRVLENGLIDRHAVRDHAERILVILAVAALAGCRNILVQIRGSIVCEQI